MDFVHFLYLKGGALERNCIYICNYVLMQKRDLNQLPMPLPPVNYVVQYLKASHCSWRVVVFITELADARTPRIHS